MKTKLVVIIMFCVLCSWHKNSNAQNFAWAKQMGGTSPDMGHAIAVDNNGNVYTTGEFLDTGDFDPGVAVYNLTGQGCFVSKLDASGNFVWAKQFSGQGLCRGYSITVDSSGNVYITGILNNVIDFDPGIATYNLTTFGGTDIFVCKLDGSGNFVWAKQMGGLDFDYGRSLAIDMSGNVLITGFFNFTADFDPGPGTYNLVSNGSFKDIFISKLDASGNFLWAKQMGGINIDEGYSLFTDNSSNVYTTGYFRDTVDFNPGPGTYNLISAGQSDIFVSKLDSSGNFLWANGMGGTNEDYGSGVTVDLNGNVLTTGSFYDTVDFDPGIGIYNLTSFGNWDAFITRFDASGNFIWAKQLGGAGGGPGLGNDNGNSIYADANGNVLTTGIYYATGDFDPGIGVYNLFSAGFNDVFISKLDSSGSFTWALSMGGSGGEIGYSAFNSNGDIHTVGSFSQTADFDPGTGVYNMTSVGNVDIFVVKLGNITGVEENVENNAVSIYPNPSTDKIAITFPNVINKGTIEIYNVLGEKVFIQKPTAGNRQQITIDVLNWNKGIYFVKVSDGEKQYAQKVIIQ